MFTMILKKCITTLVLASTLATPAMVFAEGEASAAPTGTTTQSTTVVTNATETPVVTTTADAPAPVAAPTEATPVAASAPVAEAPKADKGDTAWVLISSALVLFMTIPGLALFYAGMVRKKNVLATIMQSFAICAAVTVTWIVLGYSLAFAPGNAFIGGLSKVLMNDMPLADFARVWIDGAGTAYTIPEALFMMFQMTFAIITPALITGAFAERMKFSSMLVFSVLWSLLVYSPVCHWVWQAGGWLFSAGALDYAGGTVVHVNAGIAGLVCAIVLGKRVGFGKEAMPPHNLVLTLIGASMLWVGWFGFNAGSALAADGRAVMAMVATQIAAAAAAITWILGEWFLRGKPSALGIASGAVAGLVAITPAAGFVSPTAALGLGAAAGLVCFWGATGLKHMMKYDDSLDAFGVHGVGGIFGALLTGLLASKAIGGSLVMDTGKQMIAQLEAVGATIAFSAIATYLLLKLIDLVMGLRVTEEEEREGLDLALHGERID